MGEPVNPVVKPQVRSAEAQRFIKVCLYSYARHILLKAISVDVCVDVWLCVDGMLILQ